MSEPARKRRPYAPRVPMAARREQLLDAALTIIDRDGYDGVSIDAIAREAGVTRPVVYSAFDGLGPLLTALLDRQQERALAQLFAALPLDAAGDDPVAVVGRAVPALHAMVLADPVTWRAILASPATVPAVVRERIEGDRERVRAVIEQLVAGVLGDAADTEVLSQGILALLDHFGRLVLADPGRFTAERLAGVVGSLTKAWFA
ncbi:TetR/AcrR family transcriptional regulator [Nocardioides sp. BYT-33-1]|uniref:TetR/AcrR family transcriptional regulator n=1 Tax=Nocardioides sp. BYT-33-1 TaxID=3416952 RepID=UPI003F53E17B